MGTFSKSAIVGLVFGILLAAYAVFAFTPPSAAPPGGNVLAPVNVGGGFQEKTGDLWVRALGATSGLTVSGQSVCLANGTNCPPSGVPSGFVGFFNIPSCPSGWSELAGAQGRYIVGKPSGGTLGGTVGTALSNQEDRPVGQHSHTGSAAAAGNHTHPIPWNVGGSPIGQNAPNDAAYSMGQNTGAGGNHSHTLSINNAGSVAGTNAPYIQLLVCQKS